MNTFKHFSLRPELMQTLEKLGFSEPTDIQKKALPILLDQDKKVDFHGKARTGTGKTLAFGLPLVNALDTSRSQIQALIVAPTRELVVQISNSLEPFARAIKARIIPIYGGASMVNQCQQLRQGAHIVVGTPGRLLDHLSRRTIDMRTVRIVVLDEADIMLDMGFKEDVDQLLEAAAQDRTIWLFSATVKPGISSLIKTHMKDVVTVDVDSRQSQPVIPAIKQFSIVVAPQNRFSVLQRLIESEIDPYMIIFCSTKIETAHIAEQLSGLGYPAYALHGDMDQKQRNRVIERFRKKEFPILVATDVVARGIDVPGITHVFNYGVPDDIENYIHRIGRTGRAGNTGVAVTIINPNRRRYLERLKNQFGMKIDSMVIPTIDQIVQIKTEKAKQWLMSIAHRELDNTKYLSSLQNSIKECDNQVLAKAMVGLLYDRFFGQLPQVDVELETQAPGHFSERRFSGNRRYNNGGRRFSSRSDRSDRSDRSGRSEYRPMGYQKSFRPTGGSARKRID